MPVSAKHSGTWKNVPQMYAKVEGVWLPVEQAYVRVAGVWEPIYTYEEIVVVPETNSLQYLDEIFDNVYAGLWASSRDKRLIVPYAVGPLVLNELFGGRLMIHVQGGGSISGIGGVAGVDGPGGDGGHAFDITAGSNVVVINDGAIRGGGGGGGRGGTGGMGRVTEGPLYRPNSAPYSLWRQYILSPYLMEIIWNSGSGDPSYSANKSNVNTTSQVVGNYTYLRGSLETSNVSFRQYRVSRYRDWNTGGTGGAGGRGQGADGAAVSGSSGSAGTNNAGAGGTGGIGGSYGNAGTTGATGANGNQGSGSAGSSGGVSGKAIRGYNRVIYVGGGSLLGGTSNA